MRLVIQRVKEASVAIDGVVTASIGQGLAVLAGFGPGDAAPEAMAAITKTLEKTKDLRIFPDEAGLMNTSLLASGGEWLLVSQFTLYADCRKGRRPSFHAACPPEKAEALFSRLCAQAQAMLPGRTQHGVFAANMDIRLVNWGPVTICLDSEDF